MVQNQCATTNSDNNDSQNCPNKPETHKLSGRNTPKHTKDNKNTKADHKTGPQKDDHKPKTKAEPTQPLNEPQ